VTFEEIPIPGAFLIRQERLSDERGFFARTFCRNEFHARGLPTQVAQCNTSFNVRKGTLRGMHFQTGAMAEAKLVRCTRGMVFDAFIDLRPDSSGYLKWHAHELSEENGDALFLPEGVAHGFQTLLPHSEVHYQMFNLYDGASASGVRWDDPLFAIAWPPEEQRTISEKDLRYPDFKP
jgi:dTDP-4-dehydrorhamnose 3,5-epimerase